MEPRAGNLQDLQLVQGHRIGDVSFENAILADRIDPFPHGRTCAGENGSITPKDFDEEPALVFELIRSIDGGLPDYILEQLYRSLHSGDSSLYDFIGLFDRRLIKLWLRTESETMLVTEADKPGKENRFLSHFARLGGRVSNEDLLKIVPALLSRSRNLNELNRVVQWWTNRKVSISARFDTKRDIEVSAQTRIGKSGQNNALGMGTILGEKGSIAQGRIEIDITCSDRNGFILLKLDEQLISGLWQILKTFFRDNTKFKVFALIPRGIVDAPRISARKARADQLGSYNCLCPKLNPAQEIRIEINPLVGSH